MQFGYGGTGGLPGIGYGNPFSDALNMLIRSRRVMLSFILVVGAAIVPWAALFLLLLLVWRTAPMRAIRKWLRGTATSSAPQAARTDCAAGRTLATDRRPPLEKECQDRHDED